MTLDCTKMFLESDKRQQSRVISLFYVFSLPMGEFFYAQNIAVLSVAPLLQTRTGSACGGIFVSLNENFSLLSYLTTQICVGRGLTPAVSIVFIHAHRRLRCCTVDIAQ